MEDGVVVAVSAQEQAAGKVLLVLAFYIPCSEDAALEVFPQASNGVHMQVWRWLNDVLAGMDSVVLVAKATQASVGPPAVTKDHQPHRGSSVAASLLGTRTAKIFGIYRTEVNSVPH